MQQWGRWYSQAPVGGRYFRNKKKVHLPQDEKDSHVRNGPPTHPPRTTHCTLLPPTDQTVAKVLRTSSKNKIAGSDEEKAGGRKRAVPGRVISTLPPRRGGAPTAVLSPARRSAAVRMGRGGTARPLEAEWSSGVAAFLGGVL